MYNAVCRLSCWHVMLSYLSSIMLCAPQMAVTLDQASRFPTRLEQVESSVQSDIT